MKLKLPLPIRDCRQARFNKAKGKNQKAKVTDESRRLPSYQQGDTAMDFCLLPFAFCLAAQPPGKLNTGNEP